MGLYLLNGDIGLAALSHKLEGIMWTLMFNIIVVVCLRKSGCIG